MKIANSILQKKFIVDVQMDSKYASETSRR